MPEIIQVINPTVSPVDALWSLFQSQSIKVKKEFVRRLKSFEEAESEAKKMKAYEATLTQEQRKAAAAVADSIKVALDELGSPGIGLGRDVEELFRED